MSFIALSQLWESSFFSMAGEAEEPLFWKDLYSFPLGLEENICNVSSLFLCGYFLLYEGGTHDGNGFEDCLELCCEEYFVSSGERFSAHIFCWRYAVSCLILFTLEILVVTSGTHVCVCILWQRV